MPRYLFHCASKACEPDDQGADLPDDHAARQMAVRFAGEVIRDNPKELWDHGSWRVEVTDPDDVILFTVTTTVDAPKPKYRILAKKSPAVVAQADIRNPAASAA